MKVLPDERQRNPQHRPIQVVDEERYRAHTDNEPTEVVAQALGPYWCGC